MGPRFVSILAASLLTAGCNTKEHDSAPPDHTAATPRAEGSAGTASPDPEPPADVRLSEPVPIALPAGAGQVSLPSSGLGIWVAPTGVSVGLLERLEGVSEWAPLQAGRRDPNVGREQLAGAIYDSITDFGARARYGDPPQPAPELLVFADRSISMEAMQEVMSGISLAEVASFLLVVGTRDGAQGIPTIVEHFDVPAFDGALPTSYAVDFELVPVGEEFSVYARGRPESAPVASALWGGPTRRLADPQGACLLSRQGAMALLARAVEATCDTPSSLRLPVPEQSSWGDFVGTLPPGPSPDHCQAQLRLLVPQPPAQKFLDEARPLPAPTDTDCSKAVSPDDLATTLAGDGEALAEAPEEQTWREIRALDENHRSFAAYASAHMEIRPWVEGDPVPVLTRLVFLQTDDLIACANEHRKAKGDRHVSVGIRVDAAGQGVLANPPATAFAACIEPRIPGWWFPEIPGAPHEVLFSLYAP